MKTPEVQSMLDRIQERWDYHRNANPDALLGAVAELVNADPEAIKACDELKALKLKLYDEAEA